MGEARRVALTGMNRLQRLLWEIEQLPVPPATADFGPLPPHRDPPTFAEIMASVNRRKGASHA